MKMEERRAYNEAHDTRTQEEKDIDDYLHNIKH